MTQRRPWRVVQTIAATLLFLCAFGGSAFAKGEGEKEHWKRWSRIVSTVSKQRGGPEAGAPEIDPSFAGAAIVLLVGGILVLNGRRIRRRAGRPLPKS